MFKRINNYSNEALSNIKTKINVDSEFDYEFSDEDDKHIVDIYLNDKLKLKAEYQIIGMYNIPLSIWYWGWNIAFVNKNTIVTFDNIQSFLDEVSNPKEADELHYILTNGNFYISNENIKKIIDTTLFLKKGIWILPIKYKKDKKNTDMSDKIEYILITKILQYG